MPSRELQPGSTPNNTPLSESTLFDERLISLHQARKLFPCQCNEQHPSLKTVYRWTNDGVRGVRLESLRLPGGKATSVEAVARFIKRYNEACGTTGAWTPTRRRRQMRAADQTVARHLRIEEQR